MKKISISLLVVVSAIFIAISATNAYLSDQETSVGNSMVAGVSSNNDIIINEFMPNPGVVNDDDDDDSMPNGEWVELYNKGSWPIDVAGWYLYDNINANELLITTSNVSGGSILNPTEIPAHGFLAVYRNGDSDFSLNNNTADQVRLYNGTYTASLIDSYGYTGSTASKTYARDPITSLWDGLNNHTPTPGGPNV